MQHDLRGGLRLPVGLLLQRHDVLGQARSGPYVHLERRLHERGLRHDGQRQLLRGGVHHRGNLRCNQLQHERRVRLPEQHDPMRDDLRERPAHHVYLQWERHVHGGRTDVLQRLRLQRRRHGLQDGLRLRR